MRRSVCGESGAKALRRPHHCDGRFITAWLHVLCAHVFSSASIDGTRKVRRHAASSDFTASVESSSAFDPTAAQMKGRARCVS